MRLKRLAVLNFRNLQNIDLPLQSGTVSSARTGAGKAICCTRCALLSMRVCRMPTAIWRRRISPEGSAKATAIR